MQSALMRSESDTTNPKDNHIDIKKILQLDLKVVAFMVASLCGSAAPYVDTKSQMKTAVECFRGTIFNWCEGVLANMKGQLTKAKNTKLKNFGYGTILISFALEIILLLASQLIPVDRGEPRDPRMVCWVALMARHGGDDSLVVWFTPAYFMWLQNQVFPIEDFPYAGIHFIGDLELSLPPGAQWDESATLRRFERWQADLIVPPQDQAAEILTDMEHNLERLTIDIPETGTDDIPLHL